MCWLLCTCGLINMIVMYKIPLVQAEIEIGDGLPDIRSTRKCLEALKQAGFEASCKLFP